MMRYPKPIEIIRDSAGVDETCRRNYSLNDFAEIEAGTHLDTLFYYWDALRGGGPGVPHVDEFRPDLVFGPEMNRWVCGVDTRFMDPENFVIRKRDQAGIIPHAIRMSNRRISEYPTRLYAEHCMREYQKMKEIRQPQYHEIEHLSAGVWRQHSRIMMPLCDDTGEIVHLAYGYRLLDIPVRYFEVSSAPFDENRRI